MATLSSRNVWIAGAGAAVLAVALGLILRPHAAASHQPNASSANSAQSGGQAAANTAGPRKPSAYGEAFLPARPSSSASPPSAAFYPIGTGHVAGLSYPSVAEGVMAAKLISGPPPSYPFLARVAHIEGQVTLQAVISPDGAVSATRVLSGHHLLRGAAVAAVRLRRYRPYVLNGQPINVATTVTVAFHPPS
jgi:TonB family protein